MKEVTLILTVQLFLDNHSTGKTTKQKKKQSYLCSACIVGPMTSCYEEDAHLPKVNKVGFFVCTKPYSTKITTATLIIVLLMRYQATLYIIQSCH